MDLFTEIDDLRRKWTDQYVTAWETRTAGAEAQLIGIVGRVVTVNCNRRAVIDFQDGGWYDVGASEEFLNLVPAAEAAAKYKNVNSAQPIPAKGG